MVYTNITTKIKQGQTNSSILNIQDYLDQGLSFGDALDTAMIDAGAGGRHIKFPSGEYVLTTEKEYVQSENITWSGEGKNTKIYLSGVNTQINFKDVGNIDFRDMVFEEVDKETTFLNTMTIKFANARNIQFDNVDILNINGFGLFVVSETPGVGLVDIFSVTNSLIEGNGLNDLIGGGPNVSPYASSQSLQVRDLTLVNNTIRHTCSVGRQYRACCTITRANNLKVIGNTSDGSIIAGIEQYPNTKVIISNNNVLPVVGADYLPEISIYVSASNATIPAEDIVIMGNNVNGSILVQGAPSIYRTKRVTLIGNNVHGKGDTDEPGNRGIEIVNVDRLLAQNNIENCHSGYSLSAVENSILQGTVAGCENGINLFGDLTNSVVDVIYEDVTNKVNGGGSTTGTVWRHTDSYKTFRKGTLRIESGTNSTVVNHGLDRVPNSNSFLVTPLGVYSGFTHYWVENVDATTFTLRTNANATADIDFAWQGNITSE